MAIGESIYVFGEWFQLYFVENKGMAYGMSFGGEYGKLALSLLRIVAIGGIGYLIYKFSKERKPTLLLVSMSLIFAGAMGNVLDSAFYGLLFSQSSVFDIAQFMPAEGGYATFLHGSVVDMLYFPLFEGEFPSWLPIWGGDDFLFFRPVFNIADSSIFMGVMILIIFQNKFFGNVSIPNSNEEEAEEEKI